MWKAKPYNAAFFLHEKKPNLDTTSINVFFFFLCRHVVGSLSQRVTHSEIVQILLTVATSYTNENFSST